MKKSYYIIGALLFGVGAFFLYKKIKNANVNVNSRSQDIIAEYEDGSHLNPPNEVPPTIPTLATPPIV